MASLSGIHMFLKSQDIKLNDTHMPDTVIVWKEYVESVILIAIASGTTKKILDYFIDAVFNAMIFVVGIEEIKNPRNLEKLKKDLLASSTIIDRLFDCLDIGDRTSDRVELITLPSCILCPENNLLRVYKIYYFIENNFNSIKNSWYPIIFLMGIVIEKSI